jgi:hypothetical protein
MFVAVDCAPRSLCEPVAKAALNVFDEVTAFGKFWKQAEQKLRDGPAGWQHTCEEVTSCLASFQKVEPYLTAGWNKLLKSCTKKLDTACIDKVALNSKRLMSSKELQSTLADSADKLSENGNHLMTTSSELLGAMKLVVANMPDFKVSMRDLARARKYAKTVISVDWAIKEVANFEPESGSQMEEKGRKTLQRLEAKVRLDNM